MSKALGEAQSSGDMAKSSRTSSSGSVRNEESNSPPGSVSKKRTKASRACDQCRKRKIKCDFSEEKGICTSCSKNADRCAFDRVPLKRGPSKGYVRGHSRTRSVTSQQDGTDAPSPPSRSNSVLLPPLAQYLPQPGAKSATAATAAPTTTANASMGQQQFWKVPYHEFPNQRRGSIDSLQSDLSVGKGVSEQLLYTTPTGSQNLQSPNPATGNNDFANGYWSFIRNSNSVVAPEEFAEIRRKSGSFPPLLRHPSNASISQQQQQQQQQPSANTLYPYSQFTQQQPPQGKASMSSFGQFGSNGFESRNGSIASEGMSPSAPGIYQSAPMTQSTSNNPKAVTTTAPSQPLDRADSVSSGTPSKNSKRRKRNISQRRGQRADSNVSMTSENSSIRPPSCESSYGKPTIIYGQISDVNLIDTYYEFIHVGFPIIPLNKKTLTNEILLINTQPISTIHEINNYVILWFRNALELLVRISLKKRYNQFFEAPRNDNENNEFENSGDSTKKRESNENDDFLENKALFISALNECLQKNVDIHPKFRENRQEISPKIEIIYLSTFILLNYILAFVGYDNSFVLGMSVTIFKEFKVFEQFIWGDIQDQYDEMSIAFKRLYFSLVIFDSLQSCCYGGAKLLNVPIQGATEKLFKRDPENSKWDIDEDPFEIKCILQTLKLGELITDFVSNRRSVCDVTGQKLLWEPNECFNFMQQSNVDEPLTTVQIFHDFLLIKNEFTNKLLSIQDSQRSPLDLCMSLTNSLCTLISLTLRILTLIMKLNPTNRIDYNYRPTAPTGNEPVSKNSTGPIQQTKLAINRNGSDFYQKLLGLQQNKESGYSEILKGVISPYSIAILHEIRNTNELLQQMPTSLIGIVMTIPANPEREDQAKSQELVVKLSNSMNEVVQITSLLNLIKPVKMCEQDASTMSSWRYLADKDDTQSIMQRLYKYRTQQTQTQPQDNKDATTKVQPTALDNLTEVGWKLLDDKELGWF